MTERRNPTSGYLLDQGKRTQLLDSLACAYECIEHLCTLLLSIEHGGLSDGEQQETLMMCCDEAMNIIADYGMFGPMLLDIYHDDGQNMTRKP